MLDITLLAPFRASLSSEHSPQKSLSVSSHDQAVSLIYSYSLYGLTRTGDAKARFLERYLLISFAFWSFRNLTIAFFAFASSPFLE